MSDLISRSVLFEEIERQKSSLDKDCEWSYNMTLNIVDVFCKLINKIPTVEAKPVVHGEWHLLDKCSNAGVYCSVCHKKVYKEPYYANVKVKSNFCPNCGADMRGGKNGRT